MSDTENSDEPRFPEKSEGRESEPGGLITSRVSDDGETTIPPEMLEAFGIEPGDELLWDDEADVIRVAPRPTETTKGAAFDDDVPREKQEAWVEEANARLKERRKTVWDGGE
jgi:bifunctional DNA-binding transcriptional regulator/antitoxin component of YhaV-PrlF toxin-antitoxin module